MVKLCCTQFRAADKGRYVCACHTECTARGGRQSEPLTQHHRAHTLTELHGTFKNVHYRRYSKSNSVPFTEADPSLPCSLQLHPYSLIPSQMNTSTILKVSSNFILRSTSRPSRRSSVQIFNQNFACVSNLSQTFCTLHALHPPFY